MRAFRSIDINNAVVIVDFSAMEKNATMRINYNNTINFPQIAELVSGQSHDPRFTSETFPVFTTSVDVTESPVAIIVSPPVLLLAVLPPVLEFVVTLFVMAAVFD